MKADHTDIKTEEEKEVKAAREERWEVEDEGSERGEDSSPQSYQTLQQSQRLTLLRGQRRGQALPAATERSASDEDMGKQTID